MTQTLPRKTTKNTQPARSTAREKLTGEDHALLTRRYDQVYQEWSRQDAVVISIRGDIETGPGDDADHAAMRGSLDEEVARAEELQHQLDEVRAAMERMDSGTYGSCERCGNEIPAERLELFPTTTLCVDCKKLAER